MSRATLFKSILLALFCALQIADVVTTNRILGQGGWESNPIQAWSMATFGAYWPVPKFLAMAVCAAWMFRWTPRSVAPLVAVMGLVVANNAVWAYA